MKGCCHKPWMMPGFMASGEEDFNLRPEMRLDHLLKCDYTKEWCPRELWKEILKPPMIYSVQFSSVHSLSHVWPFATPYCSTPTSLEVQWLRVCLPVQGTWIQSLVQEDPTCHRATKPTTTESLHPRVCALQEEKPLQEETCAPQLEETCTQRQRPSTVKNK